MAWIESHQSLGSHPKTKRLTRLLGCSRAATVGHLHFLWWWALDHAQDGDLSGFDIEEIADEAKWDGDAAVFVSALKGCGIAGGNGFLTDDGHLHDWQDYAGKLLDFIEKRREAGRKGAEKRWHGAPNGTPIADPIAKHGTRPNLTRPNQEEPTSPAPQDDPSDFEEFWNLYPKCNNGKKPEKKTAQQVWKRMSQPKRHKALAYVRNYAAACKPGGQYAKYAHRWLRDELWNDWTEPARELAVDPKLAPAPYGKPSVPVPECPHGLSVKAYCEDCETKEES